MIVLLTGANGFLGSNIYKKLADLGHNVIPISRSNVTNSDCIRSYEPDVFIHCGWEGGNNYNDVNSTNQFDNVRVGVELLQILTSLPKKPKFIGFGSFAEYGTLSQPAVESMYELPQNMYGLSKLTLKNYTSLMCNMHGNDWAWVRPCYVYGPGDVSTRLIPKVISSLLKNKVVYLDSCNKVIDYIYISDFVNLFCELLINGTGVFNVCSGEEYNLKDVILAIGELLNATNNIVFDQTSTRHLTSDIICGSNVKIMQLAPNHKNTNLTVGLYETIQYYRNDYERFSNNKR